MSIKFARERSERLKRLGIVRKSPSPPPRPQPIEPLSAVPSLAACDIQKLVAAAFGISHLDLLGRDRRIELVTPRQVSMLLCSEFLKKLSYTFIGHIHGDRDHTTVMSALKRMRAKIADDPDLADKVALLGQQIVMRLPSDVALAPATPVCGDYPERQVRSLLEAISVSEPHDITADLVEVWREKAKGLLSII